MFWKLNISSCFLSEGVPWQRRKAPSMSTAPARHNTPRAALHERHIDLHSPGNPRSASARVIAVNAHTLPPSPPPRGG